MDRVEAGVTREAENLDKANSHLDDTAVDGHTAKTQGSFPGEFFGRGCRGLAEDVFAEAAHDHHKADDCGEDGLESLVADADQEEDADAGPDDGGNQQLEENFLVEVAVTGEVCHGTDVSDDETDAVGAVCHRGGHAKEYHNGQTQGASAPCDAVDEANDCAQHEKDGILAVFPPGGVHHLASSFFRNSMLSRTFCFWL